MTGSIEQHAATRSAGPELRQIAIGAGAAVLVLAVAGLAFAAGMLQAPAQPAPQSAGGQIGRSRSLPGNAPFFGRGQGRGVRAPRGFGSPQGLAALGFRQITISAVSGSSVTVQTEDGWTRTITVTSSTTITKAGQTITVADLKVGDQIRFGETRNSDGTYAITRIEVVLPTVVGRVTATTADTITIQRLDGTSMTVHVGGTTTYQVPGVSSPGISDITVGMLVWAQGSRNADGSLQADAVYARPQR